MSTFTSQPKQPPASPSDKSLQQDEPDVISQLQTCLDQLNTQLYASLRYVITRHPMSGPIDPLTLPPPSLQTPPQIQRYAPYIDPLTDPLNPSGPAESTATANGGPTAATDDDEKNQTAASPRHQPVSIPVFRAAVREVSQDLVTKQKQIQALIALLPPEAGEGTERERQERRLEELDKELRGLRGGIARAREKREALRDRVDGVIGVFANGGV